MEANRPSNSLDAKGFRAIDVELLYAPCAQAGGATVMLLVSVGMTSGVPATGMTVPLGPITVPAGILAGLTAKPALAGVGFVLVPSEREPDELP